jgi:hypothetical protein
MPVISDLRLPLTVEDVSTAWGSRRTRLASPSMRARVSEILSRVDAGHWLEPAVSYRIWAVSERGREWVELAGGSRLHATLLAHRLQLATHFAVGVCTVGSVLEKQVSQWFASGDRLRSVLLDDIGTLALYQLSDRLEEMIREEAAVRGLDASGVLNPGDDGFDLRDQTTIIQLAGGADIGVSVTPTSMLAPRKTLSMVIGLGQQMPKWSRNEYCARCRSRDRCPHRRSLAEAALT